MIVKGVVSMISRILGLVRWLLLFWNIFQKRGLNTYGKEHVQYVMERFVYEHTFSLEDSNQAGLTIDFIANFLSNNWCYCHEPIRIGPPKDSGYVIADLYQHPDVLSGGAGKNIDFELYFSDRKSEVHIYDPTVTLDQIKHANVTHHKVGLESSKSSRFKNSISLKQLDLTVRPQGLYLKLDIEGSEWNLLSEAVENLIGFDQVIVEFHEMYRLSDSKFRTEVKKLITYLNLNFTVINYHPNNWRNWINFGHAMIPEVFEVTMINRKHCVGNITYESAGEKGLNFPNNPNRLELSNSIMSSNGKLFHVPTYKS